VILPRLAAPLGPLLLAAARGSLDPARGAVRAMPGAAVGIVLAAAGYPASPRRGDAIAGLQRAAQDGALVFHAGTKQEDGTWTTDGGRVLTVVGRGQDLEAARERAESAADAISWDGLQRRRDIGRVRQSVPA
jgi:phosphoribosylamine--glycine ligase